MSGSKLLSRVLDEFGILHEQLVLFTEGLVYRRNGLVRLRERLYLEQFLLNKADVIINGSGSSFNYIDIGLL